MDIFQKGKILGLPVDKYIVEGGLWLDGFWVNPNLRWGSADKIAFRLRK